MRIGFTYDLKSDYLRMGFSEEDSAEFDREDTISSIEEQLDALGHETDRIGNVFELVKRLADGDRWDLVFNIAEGVHGLGREAQVPALLDAYRIPYTFSDPLVLCASLHKPTAKCIAQSLGVPTPAFRVVSSTSEAAEVSLEFPVFAKPVAEGTSKGIGEHSLVRARDDLVEVCSRLLTRFAQPVLVERYLPGREFTVGIVGTGEDARAAGVLEFSLRHDTADTVYTYTTKENCEELVDYWLADDSQAKDAVDIALAVWQGFGCRDAGRVDLRTDENGTVNFVELNPLAGLHPTHSDLPIIWSKAGREFGQLIREIVESAAARVCGHSQVTVNGGIA